MLRCTQLRWICNSNPPSLAGSDSSSLFRSLNACLPVSAGRNLCHNASSGLFQESPPPTNTLMRYVHFHAVCQNTQGGLGMTQRYLRESFDISDPFLHMTSDIVPHKLPVSNRPTQALLATCGNLQVGALKSFLGFTWEMCLHQYMTFGCIWKI